VLALAAPLGANEHAGCADINNSSNNRLSVFKILKTTGALELVQEIPTGGHGADGGYYSLPQIASTRANRDGKACVFVVNAATHDITAFRAAVGHPLEAPCDCFHEIVQRLPVSDDVAAMGNLGGGVAVSPDGSKLYSANPGNSTVSTFDIAPDCSLSRVEAILPAPERPADIQATQLRTGGRCVALTSPSTNRVSLYRAAPTGMLAAASSYEVPGPGQPSGAKFSSRLARDTLYVVKADPARLVVVRYHVNGDCSLETSPGPMVTVLNTGRSSSVAELDPENRCLFVHTQRSPSISLLTANHPPSTLATFSVNPVSGDLQPVTTVEDSAFLPAGLDFADIPGVGRFLYYTSFSREVFRRPVIGCVPGPVLGAGVRTGVPGTGLLRALTVLQ
jgi:6-phosphogluconolactonase (cycloisomerase 2 family)